LTFTQAERYSFSEWLQLTSFTAIDRDEDVEQDGETEPHAGTKAEAVSELVEEPPSKQERNFDLIDQFIANKPKIKPGQDTQPEVDIKASLKIDKQELMTETLAKVYLEQKKYKKAIQAYKILRLKYPEKSSFFADRISAVKKLQKENK